LNHAQASPGAPERFQQKLAWGLHARTGGSAQASNVLRLACVGLERDRRKSANPVISFEGFIPRRMRRGGGASPASV